MVKLVDTLDLKSNEETHTGSSPVPRTIIMQTFLPYDSFYESARCLDNKRLGKQRVECKQIYLALTVDGYGWKNHPAVKMWKGWGITLAAYGMAVCTVWRERGFQDSLLPFFEARAPGIESPLWDCDDWRPDWMFEDVAERVYASHRSNLLRKDPVWYGQFGWAEPNDLPYVWPV